MGKAVMFIEQSSDNIIKEYIIMKAVLETLLK
jgi:hypothetical protein